jgi:hypothetical protein
MDKTIHINPKTHQRLAIVKAQRNKLTFDATIVYLLDFLDAGGFKKG